MRHPSPFFTAYAVLLAALGCSLALGSDTWPGESSTWEGYVRHEFTVDGRDSHVVVPNQIAHGRPWVWRARFPGYHAEVDLILLERGFHIAYMNTNGMLGSDQAMRHWDAFYRQMTDQHDLAKRVALEAVSRGGLFAYRWAARHPDRVACIYADTPVLDFKSWPLGGGEGIGSEGTWRTLLEEYGFTHDEALEYAGNPIDSLEPLARFQIPLYHIVSQNDRVVPAAENTLLLEKLYRKLELAGPITVELVAEGTPKSNGHHFTLPDPQAAADFITRNTFDRMPGTSDYFTIRDGLNHCRAKFLREKRGRVVFLGGSITNSQRWRTAVGHDLERRFPDTQFEFINAGLSSHGSVPGSFRLLRDVFGQGQVDLLFQESAVNDVTNRPGNETQWQRGVEGILRQARVVNPNLDIVVMHFVDPEKIADYDNGKTPPVIACHERVIEHYGVNSIDLALEVTDRIAAGQFTWADDFRGLHPAPFGHRLYAAVIGRLFDAAWSEPLAENTRLAPHAIPDTPLDPFGYFHGHLVDIREAELGEGWQLDPNWNPTTEDEKAGAREGFVDVPMLVATQPGAELRWAFRGTAAGLWAIVGPDVGVIEYRIDEGDWQRRDQYTRWSGKLHLPWTLVLGDELSDGQHTLTLRTTDDRNAASRGHACRIVKLVVNGK